MSTFSSEPSEPSDATSRFSVRRMHSGDVALALDWADAEGWNPGLDDASCFFRADPHGFLIGECDGEPVGCISAVAYGAALGFIGLYIVRPEWRGQGFGMALWRAGIAYLGDRAIGLDGVLAQQPNYRKSGFVLAYRNVRYRGGAFIDDGDVEHAGVEIVEASRVPFDRLNAYDAHHFCIDREAFLRAWLAQPQARAFAAIDGDNVRGFGVIRRCRSGRKIGPLFAENLNVARLLFNALVRDTPDGDVYLDVPESNAAAVALALEHGMSSVFETARMYTRDAPAVPLANVFGVTTFELG